MKFILLTVFIAILSFAYIHCELAPEDQPIWDTLTQVGKNPNLLSRIFNRLPSKNVVSLRKHHSDNYQSLACDGCLAIIDTFNGVVEDGGSYDDVRNTSIGACIEVLSGEGYNKSDVMCPGIMGHYVPHILYILKTKPMESNEVCYRLNFCDSPNPEKESIKGSDSNVVETSFFKHVVYNRKKRQAKRTTFKIAQINDIHIDPEYEEGSATDCGYLVCCRRRYGGKGAARLLGEYTCNTNPHTVSRFLEEIERMNPAFILYAGDNPPHTMWEETREGQLNHTRHVVNMIAEKISDKKTYPACGNHEAYPTNLYYVQRPEIQELNGVFGKIWPTISPLGPEQLATIAKAAYYTILVKPGLRLLTYNSNYGYTANFYILLNQDEQPYADMKQFMVTSLSQAKTSNEKVILMGHHPLGQGDSEVQHAQWLTDLVLEYSDIIVLHVHGHTHRDSFKLFVDRNDGQAKSLALVAPSMTTFTNYNPSVRFYTMDSQTFELVDYEQYYIQIRDGNTASIQLSYKASEEYQLPDMSPKSWQSLSKRFENDQLVLSKYRINLYSKSGNEPNCTTDECKYKTICDTRNTVYSSYRQCVNTYVPPTPEPTLLHIRDAPKSGTTAIYASFYMCLIIIFALIK